MLRYGVAESDMTEWLNRTVGRESGRRVVREIFPGLRETGQPYIYHPYLAENGSKSQGILKFNLETQEIHHSTARSLEAHTLEPEWTAGV